MCIRDRIKHEQSQVEHALGDPDRADEMDALIHRLGELQEQFEALGGYSFESEARSILFGLGFSDAMIEIREEIRAVEAGSLDREDNPLKHAPHTATMVMASEWTHAYPRELAAFPLPSLKLQKYWPPVRRIDGAYGDRSREDAAVAFDTYDVVFSAADHHRYASHGGQILNRRHFEVYWPASHVRYHLRTPRRHEAG